MPRTAIGDAGNHRRQVGLPPIGVLQIKSGIADRIVDEDHAELPPPVPGRRDQLRARCVGQCADDEASLLLLEFDARRIIAEHENAGRRQVGPQHVFGIGERLVDKATKRKAFAGGTGVAQIGVPRPVGEQARGQERLVAKWLAGRDADADSVQAVGQHGDGDRRDEHACAADDRSPPDAQGDEDAGADHDHQHHQ